MWQNPQVLTHTGTHVVLRAPDIMQDIAHQPIYTRGNIYHMDHLTTARRWIPMCGILPAKPTL